MQPATGKLEQRVYLVLVGHLLLVAVLVGHLDVVAVLIWDLHVIADLLVVRLLDAVLLARGMLIPIHGLVARAILLLVLIALFNCKRSLWLVSDGAGFG